MQRRERPRSFHRACGLVLRSEFKLPEVFGTIHETPSRWDVDIRHGTIPPWPGPMLRTDGEAILFRHQAGRFRAHGGREIHIDAAPGQRESDLLPPVLGSGLGLVLSQRGLLPLHATGIEVGDGAVAPAGRAGAGKSTLAAHLRTRGYRVLCDDMLTLAVNDRRAPVALPGFPILKLAAGEALGVSDPGSPWPASNKRVFPLGESFSETPQPLRAIYVLEWDEGVWIEDVPGPLAFAMVRQRAFRGRWLRSLRIEGPIFDRVAFVVETVPVRTFARAKRFEALGDAVDRLLDDLSVRARGS